LVDDGLRDSTPGDTVADVEVATAGHCHGQLAAAGAVVVEGTAAVDGQALDAGDRRGVGELDVFGDVARRKEQKVAQPSHTSRRFSDFEPSYGAAPILTRCITAGFVVLLTLPCRGGCTDVSAVVPLR
jgi:hypothetical protein